MKRRDALEAIGDALDGSEAVISTVGIISREFYEVADNERNFYMVGSMGMASSIGLGVALNKPDTHVVILDGDGSLLLNAGAPITIGNHSPSNFTHVVLDNNAYGSCSREPTMSNEFEFEELAEVAGYEQTFGVTDELGLREVIESCGSDGPNFVHAAIELGGNRHPTRILDLPFFKERFRNALTADPAETPDP